MQSDQRISLLGTIIWLIAALFFLYEFFLRTFVGSIAHQLINSLNLSIEQFSLLGSAYYIAYGLMQIPVGILADRFGVKKIMVFATLVCALSTFLFAHSNSFITALAARFLMGFGSSFAFVCLLYIASNWFPSRYFGFVAGISQFIGTMGPAIAGGPLISWLAKSHMSWRMTLSNIGFLGVVLSVATLLIVKGKPRNAENTMLFLSKNESIIARLKLLFKTNQAWAVAIYSATVYVSIAAMAAVWGTDFLQAKGLNQKDAAYMISIAWIAYAIGCPLLGFMSDITRRRKPYLILSAAIGLLSMALIVFSKTHNHALYSLLFFGLGLAAAGQNIGFAAIAEHATPDTKASALGLNNGLITLSSAVVPLIIGFIITMITGSHQAEHLPLHAFRAGLSVLPIVYACALLISLLWIKETYCKPQKGFIILDT